MTTVAMEEYELMKDSKYRLYVAAIDKALKNFEYTSEWADLISALGKLNKVLLSYTKFPVIPRRIKISKRLAQCMHPALPSGVHLKALETYDIIFRCMGTNRLACDLFIYSAGLFPLMGHAAMNIRPTLLTIYETHFIPLGDRLRPALSGFLSGVLLGLDTGTDHFDRTNLLLENVCEGVDPPYFYTCIWQCVANNSPVRLPAISYVLSHYSRKLSMEDQLYLMGNDIGLMVSGLCAAVQDSSVLVQRSALDLLMVCFPMNNKQLLYADMVRLVTAALTTILRRDMSLNRRLYSWILGNDVNNIPVLQIEGELEESMPHGHHILAYGLLNDALKIILKKCTTEIPIDIKPYRLLISLFDKPQIGAVILDGILCDVFRTLYLSCLHQQKNKHTTVRCVSFTGDLTSLKNDDNVLNQQFVLKNCPEVIKNANLLFNTLQRHYIWSYIEKLFIEAAKNIKIYKYRERKQVCDIGSGSPHILELCILTDFLLNIIPIEAYAENTNNILPNLFWKLISTLKSTLIDLNQYEIEETLQLCTKILNKIQPTSLKQNNSDASNQSFDSSFGDSIEKTMENSTIFEEKLDNGDLRMLEKSKSDSKINENLNYKNELTVGENNNNNRERSYSNQMTKKKTSPRIEKKSKNKKSKSTSKLDESKNEDDSFSSENATPIPEKRPLMVTESVESTPRITAIENQQFIKCLEEYKSFYVDFIKIKLLPDTDIDQIIQSLKCDKSSRTRSLVNLLDACLYDSDKTDFTPIDINNFIKRNKITPHFSTLSTSGNAYEQAMGIASNILLEFSAFPNLLKMEEDHLKLPTWVEILMTVACCSDSSRENQLTAMNTLLEIFSLATNAVYNRRTDGSSNILITGILDIIHVKYIEENTNIIEEMCKILWNLLGIVNDQNQLILCVTLLYQIHNIFDNAMFVENVINSYLTQETINVEHVKRFFMLWHLGRNLNIKIPPKKSNMRNFDKSLLKILDNLQNKEAPNLQLLSESFVTHSLLHNDISRIINPLLLKLLASNTSRVSIRHVNITDSESQSDITKEEQHIMENIQSKKIYAVSNVNGNLMYHVTDSPSSKPSKKRWFTFAKSGKRLSSSAINMTTSINEDSNVVTRKNRDFKGVTSSPKSEKAPKNVKLIINPLSSKEVYPIGLDGSYTKKDSNSSLDSLSSSNDLTQTSNEDSLSKSYTPDRMTNGERDSGFDSLKNERDYRAKLLLESIEPIADGVIIEAINDNVNVAKMSKSHSFDDQINITKTTDIENTLVQSWSYCISESDNLHANFELEISKSAEEFFRKNEEKSIVTDIINDIVDRVCIDCMDEIDARPTYLDLRSKMCHQSSKNVVLYPIHSHICLYYDLFDTNQITYALQTLKNCINSNQQLFIKCLATSGIKNLKNNEILNLLARHRKSLLGYGFAGELSSEHVNFYRGYMFLDVIISICLNYSRTFLPFLEDCSTICEEINCNLKIQLESLEILNIITKKLITMVGENSKGFSSYIADLLIKCKMQKILLNCLLVSVRNVDDEMTFAEEILAYNNFQLFGNDNKLGEHCEAYQIQILRLINSLIVLEYEVFRPNNGETTTTLIPQQQSFLSALMTALRQQNLKYLHGNWLYLISSCLPYFGNNLKQISISVIHQICNNLEEIAGQYNKIELEGEICSDYAVTLLEALTIICHYCLLDSSQTANQNVPANTNATVSNPGEIFNNLFNVFFSPLGSDINFSSKHNSDHYQSARKTILSHMPRIISSVGKLWQTIVNIENEYNGIYGHSKIVKQQLLEFLSPISVHHSSSFLAAISVTWYERRNPFSSVKTVLPEPNASQNNLVYLILAIRVIPLDNLVQTVTAVIKNPPPTEGLNSEICLDVSVLELFYCYMRNASSTQLFEAWGSLLALIREGCSLSPPAQFLLAAILHEIMIKCCPLEEKKDQKDLQDVTAKLIDCVSQVCGSCLEQTTWLRRNFAVKEQDEDCGQDSNIISGSHSDIFVNSSHSVQAQLLLSEILAPILDICFGSSEKDKVNNILVSLMCNIVPYLKTHTVKNMPSFSACSKLLSSLSSYQYTRKAWKKDVFDLLLDNSLFQMDYTCMKFWRIIVDNLMTHDNTTFRDLMNRVSMNQSGSLNLFSSREQEYEQKAQLLKRLAYVIFCSEMDQYAKYMPDIQEQLTSSLRLSVPGVQAQVFLCFRVILLRMSPLHVTSLWPIVISEMLQVFLQIEQELSTDTEEFSSHIKLLSSLDASWATNSSNGLHALGHPHWLKLQLATAKLLDLALLLPATTLPQFQMYRWAFVGDDLNKQYNNQFNQVSFLPHVIRIADLMDKKYPDTHKDYLPMNRNELLLTMNNITQLKDLHGFFKTLSTCSNRHRTDCSKHASSDHMYNSERQHDKHLESVLEKIDKVIETDFLDRIPR
ncbi:protein dopey-1 homolog [Diorhabda sublineata]|uniref:protein dopey-1 homolog n=1 Tax=Diorhabda sublineata TaxID=1163346 RepID=UPI0024E10831|nr:protein dopey-1 homolog [Diorhabda sublineata]